MRIKVFTTFPEMIEPVTRASILGRAQAAGLVSIEAIDIRAYAENKHHNTDDAPFGGGAGMVMLAQPLISACRANPCGKRIFMSPKGRAFTQKVAEELSRESEISIICGHYEGVDQRAIDMLADDEISVGDYVLTGGELAALVIIDSVSRLIPGVLGSSESPKDESFSSGLLEYPHYTRPREIEGMRVPEVLTGGNYAEIVKWRREQAIKITFERRPELLNNVYLDKNERAFLRAVKAEGAGKMETQREERKKIVFSGIQPTGNLHLGNYIGALKNFGPLQDQYDCLYSVVDLHAITVRQNPTELRKNCLKMMALYIAAGLDPERNIIYFQSQVAAHAELAWILNCYTYMGELSRMTQYKDKCAKHADNINVGLFAYPALMAADILLYQTNYVPVGSDQKQHIEITRDIAERFNSVYGNVFTIPEPLIQKVGSRIMSLTDPTRKMSKSDPEDTFIAVLDAPDVIRKKLRRAVTDSDATVKFDAENKPGVANLISIYSALSLESVASIENKFEGQGYGVFKDAVADVVIAALEPIQQKFNKIIADKEYLSEIMNKNAERASRLAARTMSKVRRKVGLAPTEL